MSCSSRNAQISTLHVSRVALVGHRSRVTAVAVYCYSRSKVSLDLFQEVAEFFW